MALRLKPFQSAVIDRLGTPGSRAHVVCIAPTGAGKGVILEEISRRADERILLISPLIALGRQQRARFLAAGAPARCFLGGARDGEASGYPNRDGATGSERVWILSPEALRTPAFRARIRAWRPTLVAIDECHCVGEWGKTFRPAYRELPATLKELAPPRTLWMSATLPREDFREIESALDWKFEVEGAYAWNPKVRLDVVRLPLRERLAFVQGFVGLQRAPGLLFCAYRKNTEDLDRVLKASARASLRYHAGLSGDERRNIEDRLRWDRESLVVSTTAFGMGMDYSQFRWCVLWQPLPTLLSLIQAVGRVGRNGSDGRAIALWDESDFRYFGLKAKTGSEAARAIALARAFVESPESGRAELLHGYFL